MSINWDDPPHSRVFVVCGKAANVGLLVLSNEFITSTHYPLPRPFPLQVEILQAAFAPYGEIQSAKYLQQRGRSIFVFEEIFIQTARLRARPSPRPRTLCPIHVLRGTNAAPPAPSDRLKLATRHA